VSEIQFKIDALHPMILKSYRARVLGAPVNGVYDVEFETLRHAADWAETCDISCRVWLRDTGSPHWFNQAVVVQFASN